VSCIVDRTRYPAQGILGGKPGAAGEFHLDTGHHPNPKQQVDLQPQQVVYLNTPGGGGYGDPFSRELERVRQDVIAGYITPETAREFGVVVRFSGREDELVRLPSQWVIDEAATKELRRARAKSKGSEKAAEHSPTS